MLCMGRQARTPATATRSEPPGTAELPGHRKGADGVQSPNPLPPFTAMSFTVILLAIVTILVMPIVFLAWLTESDRDRARRWHRSGWSKARISQRLGITTYRVNKLLAA